MWRIHVFSKKSERLVRDLSTFGIDSEFVRRVWSLPDGDPGWGLVYDITSENLSLVQAHTEHFIDLERYDYQLGYETNGRDFVE